MPPPSRCTTSPMIGLPSRLKAWPATPIQLHPAELAKFWMGVGPPPCTVNGKAERVLLGVNVGADVFVGSSVLVGTFSVSWEIWVRSSVAVAEGVALSGAGVPVAVRVACGVAVGGRVFVGILEGVRVGGKVGKIEMVEVAVEVGRTAMDGSVGGGNG